MPKTVDTDRGQIMRNLVNRMSKDMMAELLVKAVSSMYVDIIDLAWDMLFRNNENETKRLLNESKMDISLSGELRGTEAMEYYKRSLKRNNKIDYLMNEFDKMMDERYPRSKSC